MTGGVAEAEEVLQPQAVRDVFVPLAALLLDDVLLHVEALLAERRKEEAHPVRLQPEAQGQVVRGHRLVIVGAVERGGAVEDSSNGLNVAEMFVRSDVLRSGEEHVLEEMREAGASR